MQPVVGAGAEKAWSQDECLSFGRKRNVTQTQTILETFLGVGYTRIRAGLPLEAVRVPVPRPAADEVLIRVAASSLNSLEYKLAELNFMGRTPPRRSWSRPFRRRRRGPRRSRHDYRRCCSRDGRFERRWWLGRNWAERRRRRLCRGAPIPRPQAAISELPRCRSASDVLSVRFRGPLRGRPGR